MKKRSLAIGLAVLTFLLILLGGVVHNTGSSLACPDWPTCYGSLMPEMKGGVAIEHSHRLLASSVGLLTILLAILLFKNKDLRRWGLLAVFLVVFQGILGGVTVFYRLPTIVSTAHLGMSFLFFALVLSLVHKISPPPIPAPWPFWTSTYVKITALLVFLQSVLGALMRHTGAGLVCPDLPFCYGSPWPSEGPGMLLLHMAHRWLGVLVALAVLPLPFLLKGDRRIRFLSRASVLFVLVQIGLGAASILTHLGVVAVTAHLGGAALLWGTMVLLVVTSPPSPLLSEAVPLRDNKERGAEGGVRSHEVPA